MIEIKNLSHKYSEYALTDINAKIETGFIGLLGENGAGKTTLMKLLVTLLPVQEGQVLINGISVDKKNLSEIRKLIGFMPQEFGFYNTFSVYEMLYYMCLLQKIPKKDIKGIVKESLEEVNLLKYKDRKTKSLSGGMKRRLGLACAKIHNPKYLIVDEPTVGLDPRERINMRNLLKKYSVDKTILLSTHIVEDISAICERVLILSEGEMIYCGRVKDFIDNSPDVFLIKCSISDIDNYSKLGSVIEIKYDTDYCTIKLVTLETINGEFKKVDKTLESAYMYVLEQKERSIHV